VNNWGVKEYRREKRYKVIKKKTISKGIKKKETVNNWGIKEYRRKKKI